MERVSDYFFDVGNWTRNCTTSVSVNDLIIRANPRG